MGCMEATTFKYTSTSLVEIEIIFWVVNGRKNGQNLELLSIDLVFDC